MCSCCKGANGGNYLLLLISILLVVDLLISVVFTVPDSWQFVFWLSAIAILLPGNPTAMGNIWWTSGHLRTAREPMGFVFVFFFVFMTPLSIFLLFPTSSWELKSRNRCKFSTGSVAPALKHQWSQQVSYQIFVDSVHVWCLRNVTCLLLDRQASRIYFLMFSS